MVIRGEYKVSRGGRSYMKLPVCFLFLGAGAIRDGSSSHHIAGRSRLFVPFQRCWDQLFGECSAEMGVSALWGFFCKLLNFTMANLFPLFPPPKGSSCFLQLLFHVPFFAFSVTRLTIPWVIFSLLSF